MFHHIKELQFDARVSQPDPRFAGMLLEQFGGGNGELKAAMQYFVQSFSVRQAHPDKHDLLMDIATEEFSHLEIVGATIQMLLNGVNAELKDAAGTHATLGNLMLGGERKDRMIHQALTNPQFLDLTGGGPGLTNSQGFPWTGAYVNANGDLTVDLRSNIAAESRAKIVYEYLMQFTDDPDVKDTLRFLMTREIAHFQMFAAALEGIRPNFPPGILQGDPRQTHTFYNMSDGESARGPSNEGRGPWGAGQEWEYVADPVAQVRATRGQKDKDIPAGCPSPDEVQRMDQDLSRARSDQVRSRVPTGANQWSDYGDRASAAATEALARESGVTADPTVTPASPMP